MRERFFTPRLTATGYQELNALLPDGASPSNALLSAKGWIIASH